MSAVRGWCPTAWRPMAAGDGLLVRVRPSLGRLTRDQLLGLCAMATTYGNGQIDLTNRANLQLRGVDERGWPSLIAALVALGLTDPDPQREARRAIIVAPDWTSGDDTHRIASELDERLADLPDLPGKAGFAIDAGPAPVLSGASADFRIERYEAGGLILRADGRDTGVAVTPGGAVDALIALAGWFVATGGHASGRMARHHAPLPDWADGQVRPAPPAPPLRPGRHAIGAAQGLPFGRIDATAFAATLRATSTRAFRTTPWRILLVEGGKPAISHDAAIDTDACVGAPACPQASVETRALATRLAPHVAGRLHVSGCAKGCARAAPAETVLTGRDGLYDLAFDARAGAPPVLSGLDAAQVLQHFGAA